jgi:putative transposase
MKRSRFTEEQIVAILKEHALGAKAGDLARKHGISEATLNNWKAKYGGMTVSEARGSRQALGTRAPIRVEARENARWSLDFVHDQMANGRRLWFGSTRP